MAITLQNLKKGRNKDPLATLTEPQWLDKERYHKGQQFFKKNPTPGTEMTLAQTLERIRVFSKFIREIKTDFNN